MTDLLSYLGLALTCTGGYWLLGYLGRKTYNRVITKGHR